MSETLRKLRALNESMRGLNSCLEPVQVLDKINVLAKDALGFSHFALFLEEGREKSLVPKRWIGFDAPALRHFRLKPECGGVAALLANGKTRLIGAGALAIPGTPANSSGIMSTLRTNNDFLGIAVVFSPVDGAFDEDDIEVFSLFASQSAIAYRNALSHQESVKMGRELGTLNKIGAALNTFIDTDELLKEILVAAQWALGYSQCAILLLDEKRESLVIREAYGYDDFFISGYKFPLSAGSVGLAFTEKRRILVKDIVLDARIARTSTSTLSEMACPLIVHGECLGVIVAESAERSFQDGDLELLAVFAEQVATSLRNAMMVGELEAKNAQLKANLDDIGRMNDELKEYSTRLSATNKFLERRIRELQTLYEAGKTITSSLNLDETLQAIMHMVNDIIDISSGAIMLLDEETSEMTERVRFQNDDQEEGALEGEVEAGKADFNIPLVIGDRTIGSFKFSSIGVSDLSGEDKQILQTLASQAAIAIENARLFERTQNAYYDTISSLAVAIEKRDPYTSGHSERVTSYATELASKLGLPQKEVSIIQYAGLLHDIGKIGVSDSILNKRTILNESDFGLIREHPLLGDAILSPLRFLDDAQTVVKYHHERWDGSGYPDGLKGEGIPLLARIISVADAYDAMTSDRPYRLAMSVEDALVEIEAGIGKQFDPHIAKTFIDMMKAKKG
jgi:GAF domain-containing protein